MLVRKVQDDMQLPFSCTVALFVCMAVVLPTDIFVCVTYEQPARQGT